VAVKTIYIVDDATKSLRLKVAQKKSFLLPQTSKTEPFNFSLFTE